MVSNLCVFVKVILTQLGEDMTPILIKILRWLMQPKLWRFLGFASAVIGLISYALSSSFNHIFGEWNLFKIFLYSAFSFIICLMVLFARIWQHSRSLRFKAHLAFLVLTITSVYSFVSDKVMNGKPDAYSLISCAAFAIMALSLSKQIQCGCEVDLLYFFLGCLIVQLMKIKLQLVIVGAGFSYCLVILRSSFSSIDATLENEYLGLEDQRVVIQIDSEQLANANNSSIMQQLLTCMKELQQNNSNIANMLMERVKAYLRGNYELVVTDHNFIIDALPPETINNLRETAKLLVDAGLEKECSEVYSSCRREWLEELLIKKLLGLGKMGLQDYVIGRWVKASKVALRMLFPSERRLCDRVFSEFSSAYDLCFSEVCRGATTQLLNFAGSFANQSHPTWRLFQILDLYATLRDLIPEFQSLFPDSLANEAIKIKNRLGEVNRDIFMEFGDLIFHVLEAELDAWPNGGVHPMTCAVTGSLVQAFWSREILEQIIREYPVIADGEETSFSFSVQMERVMEQFERQLEAKSMIYEDLALRNLFMMNNLRQVEIPLGTWDGGRFRKNTWQHFELYYKNSWNKVLDSLKMDSNESVELNVVAESMKDKLSLFNQHFREMCGIQSTWGVCDEKLRKQILTSLENIMLSAYRNFIARFQDVLGKHANECIEYGMSDIADRLNHLFLQQQ